jgi:glycerol-3-phosphate acyltransferase PlsY
MTPPLTWLAPVLCYLIGAIPFAFLIGRLRGVDLRKVGTGNVGAGNLTRMVGVKAGIAGALLDGFKALIPVLVLRQLEVGPAVVAVSGLAVVSGHNWSVFMRGRSGRGLAPSSGVLLGVGWRFGGGLCGFLGWASLPVISVLLRRPASSVLGGLGLSVLMLIRRVQGNPGHLPGLRAALHRAVFDNDAGEIAEAKESVRS